MIYPQAKFFEKGFGALLLAFGVIFYFFNFGKRKFTYIDIGILKYIILFCVILAMHILLFLFGQKGYLPSRPLYIYTISIILLLHEVSILSKSKNGIFWISTSIIICLLSEIIIVISQFTYINYGFGIAPNDDDYIYFGAITGSYGNPNNVATMITLMIFTLYKNGILSKQSIISTIIIFFAYFAVFLTMSRTCFVIFSIFILLYYFSSGSKLRKKNYKLGAARSILAISLLTFFAWNFSFSDLNKDSIVINRSIERIVGINNFDSDNSIEFRIISHVRLLENIHNLGIGSFSDLSYYNFFKSSDSWLMKVNPHSFIVEMSFLYGYIGFILAFTFIFFIVFDLIRHKISIYSSIFFIISFIFFQMIPSSLLPNPLFFLLCVILALPNSLGMQELRKPLAPRKTPLSLASDKIPLS